MFNWRAPSTAGLEKARVDALAILDNLDPINDSSEYIRVMTQIETLSNLIAKESAEPLNLNTVMLAVANLTGIALIVGHERAHVVTSKAISFVGKLR